MSTPLDDAFDVMDSAWIHGYRTRSYALFSGGDDSLTATHFAMTYSHAQCVLHINTGISAKKDGKSVPLEFVKWTCAKYGWPLRVEVPPTLSYREFVLKWGFPGPGYHSVIYAWLKERAIRKVIRETKTSFRERVGLINGVRAQESTRRMGYGEAIHREGCQLWIAPLYSWSKMDCVRYIERHGLTRSPVVELLHMSGECLCGAFAHENELKEIALWYPETVAEIEALQKEAEAAGKYCKWGERPPGKRERKSKFMPMCAGCAVRP